MSSDPVDIPSRPRPGDSSSVPGSAPSSLPGSPILPGIDQYSSSGDLKTPALSAYGASAPTTPGVLSRSGSFSSANNGYDESADGVDPLPPLDRLTLFDFLENLALPQRLEKMQQNIQKQSEKIMRQQQKIREQAKQSRERIGGELRKRIPDPDERLRRYRRSMRDSVDRLGRRWKEDKAVSLREKISFIAGVLNIFISGYLVGACPQYFYLWYTIQLAYFYPIRYYTYHMRGMHYFLADLCYWVNFMLVMSIWIFPGSKRLFIATFCLAFGNNAVAIAMWRNSLVFHSLDKVTSLFIHIMPCVTIHCMIHLCSDEFQKQRFPAIYNIRFSDPSSPQHYGLLAMALWSSLPYGIWQLSYHFLITVRRREAIAAGRPTSFTWLRRSYSKTWIGRFILSLPDALQEPTFMLIQYIYALLTMVPAPLWFWYERASSAFLMVVFVWSIMNGANYYIDVFGLRFQKELEQLKRDVAKWQMSPDIGPKTPGFGITPGASGGAAHSHMRSGSGGDGEYFSLGAAMMNQPSAVLSSETGSGSGGGGGGMNGSVSSGIARQLDAAPEGLTERKSSTTSS